MASGPVAIDLVAAQSPSYRNRGIARYGLAFTVALLERRPDLVGSVLVHPELPPAVGLDGVLAAAGDLAQPWQSWRGGEAIFHLTSAFEPEVPIRTLWPRRSVRDGMRLVVTLYDLIPDVFPDMYLEDPGLRRRWRVGREVVRAADHVFTLSDSAAGDVTRLLGVDERRVSVIGAGCDARFHPGAAVEAREKARAAVSGLGDRYVVYNGAIDPRKNLPRLVEAFAALPPRLRDDYQLVLPCRAKPSDVNHFMVMAERLGAAGQVLLPGFVADDTLVALYQSAALVVFPSLYEGYGLPVAEAMACGAPVIAADNSSLREIVAEEARFDALDVASITFAMERGLTDEGFRRRLLEASAAPPPSWGEVADRAAAGYEQVLAHQPRLPWRSRPVVAVVAPDPASGAPGAAAAGEAVAAMREQADVDVFAGSDVNASRIVGADRANGGYDGIVVVLGDHPACAPAAATLTDGPSLPVPPVVVATGASALGAMAAAHGDEGLADLVVDRYPGADRAEASSPATLRTAGYLLARPAAQAAAAYLVPTPADAAIVAIEVGPDAGERVGVLDLVAHPAAAGRQLLAAALAVEVPGR